MTTITDIENEESTEIVDIDTKPIIEFKSTGSELRDRMINGVINDSPKLVIEAINKKVWDTICGSINPIGEAEKFAISCLISVSSEKIIPILKQVKKFLLPSGISVLQAYQKFVLIEYINRVNIEKLVITQSEIVDPIVVVPVKKVEEPKQQYSFVDGVLTNIQTNETYKFGNRGRRPLWVLDWIKNNPNIVP